ncbi:MAG: FAD-dependent thymidylate synthase [Nitrospirota bacterium]
MRTMPLTTTSPRFLSPEPVVVLTKAFTEPFRNAIATAKTCYSGNGIVSDEQVSNGYEALARSIYQAGHHTTLQHAHFQFALSNVSRQFIWSFLHSHPFYNSEQVSQRYVTMKQESVAVPPLEGEALALYRKTVARQMAAYAEFSERLRPLADREWAARFPRSRKHFARDVKKKAQEVARYVAPVAALSYLYHTVSGITLLRYYRLCRQYDAPFEQRLVVQQMVDAVLDVDPRYRTILEEPLDEHATPEAAFFAASPGDSATARAFCAEFDAQLDGRTSKLVDYKAHNERLLADAVREVLGLPASRLSDDAAIDLTLNPARNPLLGESLNLTTHGKLARAMVHPAYTFKKKLSHTADSQDQRHRMTPASRPVLAAHLFDAPDVIVPELIREDPTLERDYHAVMAETWDAIGRLRRLGAPDEFAMYLLPNAAAVRFTESADLLNLRHKHAMRLCYNAQEEIWRASLDEALQVREVNPRIGKFLLPPCTLRDMAEALPKCPEGERYCGVKVWRLDLSEFQRLV